MDVMPENDLTAKDVVENLAEVRERIGKAAKEADRKPRDVTLTAVTKKFSMEHIKPVIAAGHRTFGENRVQEAQGKWPAMKEAWPDMELRLIGPLQTNKADDAVALFDVIETLDREKLARALAKSMDKLDRRPDVLVQVNTGEEDQKAGIAPRDALAFIDDCQREYQLPVRGVMCIPPVDEYPAPHFALLAKIAADAGLTVVSMGMSGDYEMAVNLGATHVRVGSGIFGDRPKG
ncbi:YggS family pyridoxal phosphate-dependent enzyme [Parvularcula flava]|nr:YggS family pyridoxal phosphate-dependent enzyme [Aquisalinus luteolus]